MKYEPVRAFMLEPSGTVRRYARAYVRGGNNKCEHSGYGFCNVMVPIDDLAEEKTPEGYIREVPKLPATAPFPTHCKCGREFTDEEKCTSQESLWRRTDTGELTTLRDAPPGAIWNAWWYTEHIKNLYPDGMYLIAKLPNGHEWSMDGRCSNCTKTDDNIHHCWVRHGTPPKLTVNKDGVTCAAGGGSILSGDYHGFLTDGVFTAG